MKRSAPISVALLAALGLACDTGQKAGDTGGGAPTPNIVLVMTDDQGYGDFGFAGNLAIETPHLDALAAQSAQVDRFYVSPVCTDIATGDFALSASAGEGADQRGAHHVVLSRRSASAP